MVAKEGDPWPWLRDRLGGDCKADLGEDFFILLDEDLVVASLLLIDMDAQFKRRVEAEAIGSLASPVAQAERDGACGSEEDAEGQPGCGLYRHALASDNGASDLYDDVGSNVPGQQHGMIVGPVKAAEFGIGAAFLVFEVPDIQAVDLSPATQGLEGGSLERLDAAFERGPVGLCYKEGVERDRSFRGIEDVGSGADPRRKGGIEQPVVELALLLMFDFFEIDGNICLGGPGSQGSRCR